MVADVFIILFLQNHGFRYVEALVVTFIGVTSSHSPRTATA